LAPTSEALFVPPAPGAPPLSVAQIAAAFGRSPAQYQALEAYFVSEGLQIEDTDPARLGLTVQGPVTAAEQAFGTMLQTGTFNGTSVRFPLNTPVLPAAFSSEISAISGLSEGFDRFTLPLSGITPIENAPGSIHPARTTNAITASSLHLAYGLNALYNFSGGSHWATGEAIALLLWGDGFDPADLNTFYSQDYPAGFPQVNISWYPVDQSTTPSAAALQDPSNAPQELTLDLEYSGSAAPGATLDAVYAPDGPMSRGYSPSDADMESALSTAADLARVRAISMSFGTPDHSDPSFQASFETGFAVAAQRDITLLAASGDNGGARAGGTCPSGGPVPQYPAASPQVLAVGGASPTLNETVFGSVTGLASETAWNGSGGGFSATYSAPSWQTESGASSVITPGSQRGIPDVAGPSTYNRFYYGGQPMAGNGTSFATPFWAGMITEMDALLASPLGFVTPRLYAIATAELNHTKAEGLVPVEGESGPTCNSATAGWNTATGWGTPRAGLLYEDLIGTFVDVSLNGVPANTAPASSVSVSFTVLNSSSHQPIPSLPVQVQLQAEGGYVGPCGGNLATVGATTDANGTATAGLNVPGCYLGSSVVLTVTVLSNGYFGSNSTTIHVNLLGLAGFLAIAQVFPYNVAIFAGIMAGAIALGLVISRARRRRAARRAVAARLPAPPTAPPLTLSATSPASPPVPISPPPGAVAPPAPAPTGEAPGDPPGPGSGSPVPGDPPPG
jgi:subtilase family serine protease